MQRATDGAAQLKPSSATGAAAGAGAGGDAGTIAAPAVAIAVPAAIATAAVPVSGTQTGSMPTPAAASDAAGIGAAGGPVAAAGIGAGLIAKVAPTVSGSALARQVLDLLGSGGAKLEVLPDAEFSTSYPGAGGVYDPNKDIILVPERALADPQKLAKVLVHEGVHWLQQHSPGRMVEGLGGPLAQALEGAGAAKKQGTGDMADLYHDEAQAYIVGAYLARDLGVADGSLGTDPATGGVRTYEDVVTAIRGNPLYA